MNILEKIKYWTEALKAIKAEPEITQEEIYEELHLDNFEKQYILNKKEREMILVWHLKRIWRVIEPITENEFRHKAITTPRKTFKIEKSNHIKEVDYFDVTFNQEVV